MGVKPASRRRSKPLGLTGGVGIGWRLLDDSACWPSCSEDEGRGAAAVEVPRGVVADAEAEAEADVKDGRGLEEEGLGRDDLSTAAPFPPHLSLSSATRASRASASNSVVERIMSPIEQ